MIYFLMDEAEGLIEIGVTRHMNSQLAQRRRARGNALKLLGVIDGDLVKVSEIRGRFSSLKVDRDWYRIDMAMVEFIGRKGHPWSETRGSERQHTTIVSWISPQSARFPRRR